MSKNLRACMVCSIIQSSSRFNSQGCPNCEDFLELRGNQDNIAECTSAVFEGAIAMADANSSWVAKWQRLQNYAPGTYAVKVEGLLPEEAIVAAENAGVRYVPRDGTATEDV